MIIDWNDDIELEATFAVDGVLTDPTHVVCVYKDPTGAIVRIDAPDPIFTNPRQGVWVATLTGPFLPTGTRTYDVGIYGFGAAKGMVEDTFTIAPTKLPIVVSL